MLTFGKLRKPKLLGGILKDHLEPILKHKEPFFLSLQVRHFLLTYSLIFKILWFPVIAEATFHLFLSISVYLVSVHSRLPLSFYWNWRMCCVHLDFLQFQHNLILIEKREVKLANEGVGIRLALKDPPLVSLWKFIISSFCYLAISLHKILSRTWKLFHILESAVVLSL